MKRIKETFLDSLEHVISLRNMLVLEIGCGNGTRSEAIAKRCKHLTAIEPDETQLQVAKKLRIQNADFRPGSAEALDFASNSFDIVLFTLSFHHVPQALMHSAINEALRVVQNDGFIVFLEPATNGSFFDAEIQFDACDGDERKEKQSAYEAMMSHTGLTLIDVFSDETVFHFDSVNDFIESMHPQKNIDRIETFLRAHDHTLKAERRINIYSPAR
jgi:ubiquinone/menaquinone biosynthesis C-methylase UbiE